MRRTGSLAARSAWAAVALSLGGLAATGTASAAGTGSGASSPALLAKSINLEALDLTSSIHWVSTAQPANNKATAAAGKTSAACERRLGAATGDPFGVSGITGGDVLADVKSPQFSDKANAFTQLPAANSEVVVVKLSGQAVADLKAAANKGTLSCLGAQYLVDVKQSGAGSASTSERFLSAPRHGGGNGGVHIQFVATGGLLPEKLYNDEYFYVQGRSEIVVSFLGIGSPFKPSWAVQTVAKVMQRAAKLAG